MLDGFKVWTTRRRGSVTITENGLFIPGRLAEAIPGRTCRFLWDGGTVFALEDAGTDGDLRIFRTGTTARISNKQMCAFVWDKLGRTRGERVTLKAKITDGALTFGIFNEEEQR